mmetsp:Transcript_7595/g.18853  ORF Transcript_7595/g.18853 Transcript_7595/m.18853 type:complete len:288 (-) Transcript_7595:431-1294(-)
MASAFHCGSATQVVAAALPPAMEKAPNAPSWLVRGAPLTVAGAAAPSAPTMGMGRTPSSSGSSRRMVSVDAVVMPELVGSEVSRFTVRPRRAASSSMYASHVVCTRARAGSEPAVCSACLNFFSASSSRLHSSASRRYLKARQSAGEGEKPSRSVGRRSHSFMARASTSHMGGSKRCSTRYSAASTRMSCVRNLKGYSSSSPWPSNTRSASSPTLPLATRLSYTVAATIQRFCTTGVMPVSSSRALASYPLWYSGCSSLARLCQRPARDPSLATISAGSMRRISGFS